MSDRRQGLEKYISSVNLYEKNFNPGSGFKEYSM
jgi:hypothetical protein